MEGRALIESLLDRMAGISLGHEAPVRQRASLLNHAFDRLTLRFERRMKGAAE